MATDDAVLGAVREALSEVEDPELRRSIVELGMISDLRREGGRLTVEVALTSDSHPWRDALLASIESTAVGAAAGDRVELDVHTMDDAELDRLMEVLEVAPDSMPGQTRENVFQSGASRARVIAVSSGKGGVGKSSITTNLAVALARDGAAVGLVDADVWGFSIPRMLGVDRPPNLVGRVIVPPEVHGVRCVSIGYFVDEDQAVVWRGPMLHKAMEQFLVDVYWGELDYLLVDMPPGTGDIAISLSQFLPTVEVVVVTTPQLAAQRVAVRAGAMAKKANQRVLGVIENMSWLVEADGSHRAIFGEGGGEALAEHLDVPLLGQVPIDEVLREGADAGRPVVAAHPDSPAATEIVRIADAIAATQRTRIRRPELKLM
ncbi:MAG: Mrp/NBP35 family ATP-binding protein [Acidimicrobiia bacterium]|nr:Mrp/NBP35 family ATP-binding protein [Acidimicrobiia bacterium]